MKFEYGKLNDFKYGKLYEAVARYFNTIHTLKASDLITNKGAGKVNTVNLSDGGRKMTHEDRVLPRPNNDTMYMSTHIDIEKGPVIFDVPEHKLIDKIKYISANVTTMAHFTSVPISSSINKTSGKYAFVWSKGDYDKNVEGVDQIIVLESAKAAHVVRVALDYEDQEQIDATVELANSIKIEAPTYHLISEDSVLSFKNIQMTRTSAEFLINFEEIIKIIKKYSDLTPGNIADDLVINVLKEYGVDIMADELDFSQVDSTELAKEAQPIVDAYMTGFSQGNPNAQWFGWVMANKLFAGTKEDYQAANDDGHSMNIAGIYGPFALNSTEAIYSSIFNDYEGNVLNASSDYKITVNGDMDTLAKSFWSLTIYDFSTGFFFVNETWIYSTGSLIGLEKNEEGNFVIYVGPTKPEGVQKEAWLSTGAGEDLPLDVTLRVYNPIDAAKAIQTLKGPNANEYVKIEKI